MPSKWCLMTPLLCICSVDDPLPLQFNLVFVVLMTPYLSGALACVVLLFVLMTLDLSYLDARHVVSATILAVATKCLPHAATWMTTSSTLGEMMMRSNSQIKDTARHSVPYREVDKRFILSRNGGIMGVRQALLEDGYRTLANRAKI